MPFRAALESNQPFFDFQSKLSTYEVTVPYNADHWYNKQIKPWTVLADLTQLVLVGLGSNYALLRAMTARPSPALSFPTLWR